MAVYLRPSGNLTSSGTVSLTAGAAATDYPLTYLYDLDPAYPFKATGTSCTIQIVFGAPTLLECIALINTNLAGATVTITNNAGLNQALVIPAITLGARTRNAWKDLRGLANTTATTWTITITGASANVAIGELVMGDELREAELAWGVKYRATHKMIEHRTHYHVPIKFNLDSRYRTFTGTAARDSEVAAELELLNEDSMGGYLGWLFILDEEANDPAFVTHKGEDWEKALDNPDYDTVQFVVEEWCTGRPL